MSHAEGSEEIITYLLSKQKIIFAILQGKGVGSTIQQPLVSTMGIMWVYDIYISEWLNQLAIIWSGWERMLPEISYIL